MMKKLNRIFRVISIFFIALFCYFIFNSNTLTVMAVSEDDVKTNLAKVDDGIDNWEPQRLTPSNKIGKIPIGTNISLDYTFGSARNSTNMVQSNGGDKTITVDSIPSTGKIKNSKINVFINKAGKYYGILHQGENSFIGTGGDPGAASDTSIDFDMFTGLGTNYAYTTYSVLAEMKYKVYFTGTDINGKPVYKIGGYINNQSVYAEIVLRPSITGAPIVQRELYVYNPTDSNRNASFQVYFGEDTSIDSTGSPEVDDVPLYAIGNGEGLYMYSAKDPSTSDAKLFVTNNVTDGFKDYMGEAYSNPYRWTEKGSRLLTSTTVSGTIIKPNLYWGKSVDDTDSNGDTNRVAGARLLYGTDSAGKTYPVVDNKGKQNSAYTLRWSPSTLEPGQTGHYASTIGATVADYALPTVSKTYTNSNQSATGLNHVGDTLHFKLTGVNNGFKSNWNLTYLSDKMPAGLTLDPKSVHYKWIEVTSTGSGESQVDKETVRANSSLNETWTQDNQIGYKPETNIGEKGRYIVTFDATVNNKAPFNLDSKNELTNTATFTGFNSVVNTGSKSYPAEVKIPIEIPKFNYDFTKQVKNFTKNPTGDFADSANGEKGDTIEYKIGFITKGTDALKSADFSDTLPPELKLDPDSITMNGAKQNSLNFKLSSVPNNSLVTISFKATVVGIEAKTVSNIADLTNVSTTSGVNYLDLKSDAAELNIAETRPTTSFVEVPQRIDFGTINTNGSDRILSNIRTDGKLIIDHSSDTPFQVKVRYNNDDAADAITNGTNKLIQDNGESLFFYQRQSDKTNDWHSISAESLPIKSDGFDGSYDNFDISEYIGLDKWKLRVPSGTEAGQYQGKITWSIEDTPQQ